MSSFGVHPFILGISVKTGIFSRLVELAGSVCKTSITLTFGITGITILFYYKKNWLVIPTVSIIALIIPKVFGIGYEMVTVNMKLNLNPFFWWNDMWGIGIGLNGITILKTLPFALFVILLWTIDTVSIQTIIEACCDIGEEKDHMDIKQSFLIASIRNIIGVIFGGAQIGSLWRSFLIPLYMIKRPMRICAILLGVGGVITSLTVVPIQIMSYSPLVWSVLLFGIFMPFTVTSITNIINEKKAKKKIFIIAFSAIGVIINPIFTWIASIIYERLDVTDVIN